VNAHEGKAGVVLLAGKLCDPRLSALSVVATIKALYKYTSFLSFFSMERSIRPAVSCKQTSNHLSRRLSDGFDNRFGNHVGRTAVRSTGCQTGLYNRTDNGLYRVNGA